MDEQSASAAAPSPVGAEPTNVAASGQAVVDLAAPVDPLPAGPGGGSERPSNGPSVEPGPVAPTDGRRADDPTGSPERPGPDRAAGDRPAQERSAGCTTAQLRRFIKSRAYVPMHEIRRRFLIASEDDDVTPVAIGAGHIYVGLPLREGHMLGELLRGGEIGYELQLDPVTPVVVGVYPMRPVSRN